MDNKRRWILAIATSLFLSITLQADPITILDRYVGGNDHGYGDVIASPAERSTYDITRMTVGFSNDAMTVDVFTNFVNHVGEAPGHVALGDLFIGTTGWHPYGNSSDGYKADNFAHSGSQWDYVLHRNNNNTADLYALNSGAVVLSNMMYSAPGYSWIYRDGQPVSFNPGMGAIALGTGSWSIDGGANSFISFSINTRNLGAVDKYGLSWGMTCGNDVIQGEVPAPVPEPASLTLLGSGLVGMAILIRKSKRT